MRPEFYAKKKQGLVLINCNHLVYYQFLYCDYLFHLFSFLWLNWTRMLHNTEGIVSCSVNVTHLIYLLKKEIFHAWFYALPLNFEIPMGISDATSTASLKCSQFTFTVKIGFKKPSNTSQAFLSWFFFLGSLGRVLITFSADLIFAGTDFSQKRKV